MPHHIKPRRQAEGLYGLPRKGEQRRSKQENRAVKEGRRRIREGRRPLRRRGGLSWIGFLVTGRRCSIGLDFESYKHAGYPLLVASLNTHSKPPVRDLFTFSRDFAHEMDYEPSQGIEPFPRKYDPE